MNVSFVSDWQKDLLPLSWTAEFPRKGYASRIGPYPSVLGQRVLMEVNTNLIIIILFRYIIIKSLIKSKNENHPIQDWTQNSWQKVVI